MAAADSCSASSPLFSLPPSSLSLSVIVFACSITHLPVIEPQRLFADFLLDPFLADFPAPFLPLFFADDEADLVCLACLRFTISCARASTSAMRAASLSCGDREASASPSCPSADGEFSCSCSVISP